MEVGNEFHEGEDVKDLSVLKDRLIRHIGGKSYEVLWIGFIDKEHKLAKLEQLAEGDSTKVIVEHSKIVARAKAAKAASVLMIHNHPDGDTQPSFMDWCATERLRYNLIKGLGIDIVDHLVVGSRDVHSMRQGAKL